MQNTIASKLKTLVSKTELKTKVATASVVAEKVDEFTCACGGNCGCHN